MDMPLPDCECGRPFAQSGGLLDFGRLEEQALYWTATNCKVEACSKLHCRVTFVRDVRGFVRSTSPTPFGSSSA